MNPAHFPWTTVVNTHALNGSWVPPEPASASHSLKAVWSLRSAGHGQEDEATGQEGTITHPSASDERCKWKLPSCRSNQTPSTHVNVDCQDSQPLLPREADSVISMLWAWQNHCGSSLGLHLCSGPRAMPEQVLGLRRNESHHRLPPPLPHASLAAPVWGRGKCWVELKAIHSPWFLDKLFPQTAVLLRVVQNYFQLLSNLQAALAYTIS